MYTLIITCMSCATLYAEGSLPNIPNLTDDEVRSKIKHNQGCRATQVSPDAATQANDHMCVAYVMH